MYSEKGAPDHGSASIPRREHSTTTKVPFETQETKEICTYINRGRKRKEITGKQRHQQNMHTLIEVMRQLT